MPTAIHMKSKRKLNVHIYKDGLARIALYVVGDKHWKRVDRQIAVPVATAIETAKRGECYIGMNDGSSSQMLFHSNRLAF